MTVIQFTGSARPKVQGDLTQMQAMEVHRRYLEQLQAAPTIACEMSVSYKAVCNALDGKIWPGVHLHWVDRVLP